MSFKIYLPELVCVVVGVVRIDFHALQRIDEALLGLSCIGAETAHICENICVIGIKFEGPSHAH